MRRTRGRSRELRHVRDCYALCPVVSVDPASPDPRHRVRYRFIKRARRPLQERIAQSQRRLSLAVRALLRLFVLSQTRRSNDRIIDVKRAAISDRVMMDGRRAAPRDCVVSRTIRHSGMLEETEVIQARSAASTCAASESGRSAGGWRCAGKLPPVS